MTEDEKKMGQHWQELAEQLGLDQEPGPASGGPNPTDQGVGPPGSPDHPVEEVSLPPQPQPPGEENVSTPNQGEPPWPEEHPRDEAFPNDEHPLQPPVAQEEVAEKPKTTPQGRRRGGRGRVSRSVATPRDNEAPEYPRGEPPAREKTGGNQPGGRGTRRDRSQPRRKKPVPAEEWPAPTGDDELVKGEAAQPEDEGSEMDDLDLVVDWNVPSWDELIASLYRPER